MNFYYRYISAFHLPVNHCVLSQLVDVLSIISLISVVVTAESLIFWIAEFRIVLVLRRDVNDQVLPLIELDLDARLLYVHSNTASPGVAAFFLYGDVMILDEVVIDDALSEKRPSLLENILLQ